MVYVTVDPERDTPAHLKAFPGRLRCRHSSVAPAPSSSSQQCARTTASARQKIPYGDSYTYAHSSFTYLIDRSGRIRALMPYGHSPDDYVNDLTLLLKE